MRPVLLTSIAVVLALDLPGEAAEGALPEAWSLERYSRMVEQSPFALATPVVAPVAPKDNFGTNLYVSGLVTYGDADGEHRFVTIKSRDLAMQFTLQETEEGPEGIAISNIELSPEVGKSTVTLRKGAEYAKLEFNQADVQGPQNPQPPAPGRQPPGSPPRIIPPPAAGANGLITNPRTNTGGRIQVPRPNTVVQPGAIRPPSQPKPYSVVPQTTGQPQANTAVPIPGQTLDPTVRPAAESRRRVRVINSQP